MNKSGMMNSEAYKKLRHSTFVYFRQSLKYKQIQQKYEALKADYNRQADAFFSGFDGESQLTFGFDSYDNGYEGEVTVNRIQSIKVAFDADKVEKAVGRKLAKKVIRKRYEIEDVGALVGYLRECGVDPERFKRYLKVTKEVVKDELERLEEVGIIDKSDLEGTYIISRGTPYYILKSKKVE